METRLYSEVTTLLMAESNDLRCNNKYIPSYVPDNLKWFERDGLETWYKKNKCDEFLSNTDLHFEKMKVVNFDMIRNGDKMESKKIRQYQTIDHDEIKKYPKHLQQQITSSIFLIVNEKIFMLMDKQMLNILEIRKDQLDVVNF